MSLRMPKVEFWQILSNSKRRVLIFESLHSVSYSLCCLLMPPIPRMRRHQDVWAKMEVGLNEHFPCNVRHFSKHPSKKIQGSDPRPAVRKGENMV